jgi:hypothetical protein
MSLNMSKVAAAVAVVSETFGLMDKVCLRLIHRLFPATLGQVRWQSVFGNQAMSMENATKMGTIVASWLFQGTRLCSLSMPILILSRF